MDTTTGIEERRLISLMLLHDFWEQHSKHLVREMFPGHMQFIYEAIAKGHAEYGRDLTLEDVRALYSINNPTATRAARNAVIEQIYQVAELEPFSPDIAGDILSHMWRQETFRRIAEAALKGMDGKHDELVAIQHILEQCSADFIPSDDLTPLSNEIEDILSGLEAQAKWKFNIEALADKVPGVGPGDFVIVGARPEVGKTGFAVSLCAAPKGFAWQGAKVLYIGNEEAGERTQARMVMAAAGINKDTFIANPKLAVKDWAAIKDNITLLDGNMSMIQVRAACDKYKPDVLVWDQLDKLSMPGRYDKGFERLKDLYIEARSICKDFELAGFGLSQVGAEGEGKQYLNPSMLDGSKTGKAAEADLIILIGKDSSPGMEDGPTRYLNLGKNKITGYHNPIICTLDKYTSTYRG